MKTGNVLIFLLVLLVGGAASGPAAADKIDWHTYDSGMARSKFEKKKVFLHFYADWCTYCVEMERKTFKDPAVIAWSLISLALVLWWAERKGRRTRTMEEKSVKDAILVGLAQAVALVQVALECDGLGDRGLHRGAEVIRPAFVRRPVQEDRPRNVEVIADGVIAVEFVHAVGDRVGQRIFLRVDAV